MLISYSTFVFHLVRVLPHLMYFLQDPLTQSGEFGGGVDLCIVPTSHRVASLKREGSDRCKPLLARGCKILPGGIKNLIIMQLSVTRNYFHVI